MYRPLVQNRAQSVQHKSISWPEYNVGHKGNKAKAIIT